MIIKSKPKEIGTGLWIYLPQSVVKELSLTTESVLNIEIKPYEETSEAQSQTYKCLICDCECFFTPEEELCCPNCESHLIEPLNNL